MAIPDVRTEETLRIKIAEAKNLPSTSGPKDTFCKVTFDQEHIFTTSSIEKSHNPFYGEEFKCEIPRKFRFLSFYICEKSNKSEKIIGKVSLRKNDLHEYNGKDHWFPLQPVHASSEVQGKLSIEVQFSEKRSIEVRILELNDLSIESRFCNPYAVVSLIRPSSTPHKQKDDSKRTCVKKKTANPSYDEVFHFEISSKGQSTEDILRNCDNVELSVQIYHDDSRVSRDLMGNLFPGVFLGEVSILLSELDVNTIHRAWYFLQPRDTCQHTETILGALRVKINYIADHVFASSYYKDLRNLILISPCIKPITSSASYILGQIVDTEEDAAQPLIRVFYEHENVVEFINSMAEFEISNVSDPSTLFRGNSLLSKCIDEIMKLVGLHYLQETLKETLDLIFSEKKCCEIDPSKLKDNEDLQTNMNNLENYVHKIFDAIVYSGLNCPTVMCEVFASLKKFANHYFPDIRELKYQVVSGFVFLRFFGPAIMGPRHFNLHSGLMEPMIYRTLMLISKTIQSLGNAVGSKSQAFGFKEQYMIPLIKKFMSVHKIEAVKMFLDIISSFTKTQQCSSEGAVVLKEGLLTKRTQGKHRFGFKTFKKRYFQLTNFGLFYSKSKGRSVLCEIPIQNILAVEPVQEETFTRKYVFQVVQPKRTLYIQASNCVDEKEWKHILNKICNMNKNRLKMYHPAAYLKGHWLCCKSNDFLIKGCRPVSSGLPADIKFDIDNDREIERIHSLFSTNIEKLEKLIDICDHESNYSDEVLVENYHINDVSSCNDTIHQILECVLILVQEHKHHTKSVERQTILGSQEFPFGDDNCKYQNVRL